MKQKGIKISGNYENAELTSWLSDVRIDYGTTNTRFDKSN
jgi:hypothetical protein